MPTIWKFEIPPNDKRRGDPVTVHIPEGARLLPGAVAFQATPSTVIGPDGRGVDVKLQVWAYVESSTSFKTVPRKFRVLGTDWEFGVDPGERLSYCGTAFVEDYVFHVFEIIGKEVVQ